MSEDAAIYRFPAIEGPPTGRPSPLASPSTATRLAMERVWVRAAIAALCACRDVYVTGDILWLEYNAAAAQLARVDHALHNEEARRDDAQ